MRAGSFASSESEPGLGSSAKSLAECVLRYREMLLLEVLGRQTSRRGRVFAMQMRKKMTATSRSPAEPLGGVKGDMGEPVKRVESNPVLTLSCFHSKIRHSCVLPWFPIEPHF